MKRTLLSIVCLVLLSFCSFSQTWVQEGPGFTAQDRGMLNIYIVNSQVAWVSAYDGSGNGAAVQDFSKTVNGGTTWTPGTVSNASGLSNSMITAISADTAWMCMYKVNGSHSQGVYYTTNGGTTWTFQSSAAFNSSTSFPDWIYFWDANNGIVGGDPVSSHFQIYTTSDGGTTWTAVPTGQCPAALSSETGYTANLWVDGNYVWFGTSAGRIYASANRGQNWVVAAAFADTNNAQPAYRDSLSGLGLKCYSSGDTLNLLANSTDGGNTYSPLTYHGSCYGGTIAYLPNTPNTYVTTGVDYKHQPTHLGITYSFNGGVTWYTEPSMNGKQVTCQAWLNDSTGWIGAFDTSTTSGLFKFHGVLAPPVANFMTPDTLLPLGGQATFINESTGNPLTYKWSFQGGIPGTSTQKNPPVITYNTSGTFYVALALTNIWGSDTLVKTGYIHIGGVGINELSQNAVTVFPNPVKDIMTVQANCNIKEIYVYNATGQLVINKMVNTTRVTISTTGLSAGIYSLKAIMDNDTIIKKVVIQ